jgi:hypothetical protein
MANTHKASEPSRKGKSSPEVRAGKKEYSAPKLKEFGTVAELTKGSGGTKTESKTRP